MEYSTPQIAIQQMDNPNLFLGNTLLIMAILLFLAVLPRALRYIILQKEKTILDRTVERFEKVESKAAEEQKAAAEKTPAQDTPEQSIPELKFPESDIPKHEQSTTPKYRSLDYLNEDMLAPLKTQKIGEIPPFSGQDEKMKQAKIVKEGVPISHNEATAPKKKTKLIKQEFSISPSENRTPSKRAPSTPLKAKKNVAPAKDQKSKRDKDPHRLPASNQESEESNGNWVEAEIPGLIMEPPPVTEKSESIPTFKAAPKVNPRSEPEKSQKSSQIEKRGAKVKNIAPESDEKKDSKPIQQAKIETDSPKSEMEISESKPKEVELKAPVVSHKDIAKKEAEPKEAKAPSSQAEETQQTEAEDVADPHQREDIKTSPEKEEPKPFLLELKYLDPEKPEAEIPISPEKFSDAMINAVIARLNVLQVDLENQLVSTPGELTPDPANEDMRQDRIQHSLPDLEETINESSGTKEVSLDELDSFLFTGTQKKIENDVKK